MKIPLSIVASLMLWVIPIAHAAEPAPLPRITPAELEGRLGKDPALVILDVRTPAEFAAGHVPGARNVPHDEVPRRLSELSALRDKPVVLYCRSGRRSALAGDELRAAGFTQLLHLEGDYLGWDNGSRPVEAPIEAKAPQAN